MQLATPKFSTKVKTFRDASELLAALLYARNKRHGTYYIHAFNDGDFLAEAVINMLDRVESPQALDEIIILTHSTVYYRIRKDCRSVLEMENHDPKVGYSGTFLGHRFFAHPRVRPNTIVVGGKKGQAIRYIVGTQGDWDEEQFLMV